MQAPHRFETPRPALSISLSCRRSASKLVWTILRRSRFRERSTCPPVHTVFHSRRTVTFRKLFRNQSRLANSTFLPIVMTRVEDNAVQATPANAEASKPQTAGDAASAASRVPNPSDRFPDPAANAGPATRAKGGLALSGVAPMDIYLAGKYLGTTPLTLQLPPGPQTLEFRYRGFRKTATYISRNEQNHKDVRRVRSGPSDQREALGRSIDRRGRTRDARSNAAEQRPGLSGHGVGVPQSKLS